MAALRKERAGAEASLCEDITYQVVGTEHADGGGSFVHGTTCGSAQRWVGRADLLELLLLQ